jgi:hemoglobin
VASSLDERLGGGGAISAVVEDFVARCAADDRTNGKFARTDIPRLKKMLVDQVTQPTGGPATYSGRDMK